jgi:peptidoglycan-associated lipoprotein
MALLCFSLLNAGCASKKTAARDQAALEEQQRLQEALDKAANELSVMVFFDFDKAALKPEARRILVRKSEIMKEYPQLVLTIEGHGDERGSTEYNMGLGKRRAQAAADFLVKQGVASFRLSVVSYGKDRPLDPGHNASAWAKNRYVEFKASY